MAKKRTTIFRQLILSILLPVTLLIAGISLYNYLQKKEQIVESRQQNIDLLQNDLAEFLDFFDVTLFELEKEMRAEASEFSARLVNEIFADSKGIEEAKLDSIKALIGMKDNQDIYIIDKSGVVVNTTYSPDLGLDFFAMGDYFVDHFNHVWQAQTFIEDRITIEMSTSSARKYTYQSTRDTNYVIELGLYNEPAKFMLKHFVEKLNGMPKMYEGIDTVSLFLGTNKFMSYQQHKIPPGEYDLAMETLRSGKKTETSFEGQDITYTSEYRLIPMEAGYLHAGYVLRVVHNDKKLRELIRSELLQFLWNLVLFVLPIFLLILWRARKIARPISQLVQKIDAIQDKKQLNERVPVTGNNEVTELGIHFNDMVTELQESYETLEQKVADRTKEVVKQKEIIEEVYHEIQDSINYAKRLQQATLPKISDIHAQLPETFILFRPKDVVSGDFYWFEQKGDLAFIAAADCTGHGVPGAMVSVVCSNALNRSVNEFDLREPAAILSKTRELVIETFAKSGEGVKDGMDISLCVFDKSKKEVTYAGANNPLWIVRPDKWLDVEDMTVDLVEPETNNFLIEIKANKQPIGLYENMEDFVHTTIPIKDGDVFYMFTDGYADQFGGDKGKKLKYKPFKKILLQYANLLPVEQEKLLNEYFQNWMGSFDQIDDVCVIGVKI